MRQIRLQQRARRDSLEKVDYEKRFEQQRLENEKRYANDSIKAVKLGGEKDLRLHRKMMQIMR